MACPAGAPEVEESLYASHMQKKHGGGQLAAIQKQKSIEKNIPTSLPPGVTSSDLPTKEFLKTVEEIEQSQTPPSAPSSSLSLIQPLAQKPPPANPPKSQPSDAITPKKIIPLQLTYKYIGTDDEGCEVATLEIDQDKKHFVIAYSLTQNKQLEFREVAKLTKK